MRLIERIRRAEGQAMRAADAAERARLACAKATLCAVRADGCAEDAAWYRAVAERIEGDEHKTPRHKITALEGLVIVAEQARDMAQKHALEALKVKS